MITLHKILGFPELDDAMKADIVFRLNEGGRVRLRRTPARRLIRAETIGHIWWDPNRWGPISRDWWDWQQRQRLVAQFDAMKARIEIGPGM